MTEEASAGTETVSGGAETASTAAEATAGGAEQAESHPFKEHGKLSVSGVSIVDEHGNPYQLKGVSTHGLTWFQQYVNKETYQYFKDSFGINLIRFAMYTDTEDSYGYCSGGNKEEIEQLLKAGVDAATDLDLYAVIDWHILGDGNPNTHIEEAKDFFERTSKQYADYGNVIYEIANEPNGGTTWEDVKRYAEVIIPIIRKKCTGRDYHCRNANLVSGCGCCSGVPDYRADQPHVCSSFLCGDTQRRPSGKGRGGA